MKHISTKWLSRDARTVARELLGCVLVRCIGRRIMSGRIVETEAYLGANDPASHTYRGKTKRNEVAFGPAGYAYIYFTYGLHHCLNVVNGAAGDGQAILIRALEPLRGLQHMRQIRGRKPDQELLNGPAKIAQAFRLTLKHNGLSLQSGELRLVKGSLRRGERIRRSPRIGIRLGQKSLLRFYLTPNAFVSR